MERLTTAHKIAEVISLGITPSTVILSAGVLVLWGKETLCVLKNGPNSSQCWFILGVSTSFLGAMVDNLYWGAAWTAEFFNLSCSRELFMSGVYSNIIFRQVLGSVAAYCHIRAAYEFRPHLTTHRYKRWIQAVVVCCLFSMLCLVWGYYWTHR